MPDGYGNFDEGAIADAVNSASGAAAYMSFGSFVMNDRGLHLEKEMPDPDSDPSEKKKKTKTVLAWISSPFEVLAQTRDDRSHSWGKMLRWKDPDGRSHEWAMPIEALAGTREEIWRVLMSRGLQIGTEKFHRDALAQYLSMVRVPDRVRTVTRIGWNPHGNSAVFVLPDETIGQASGERILWRPATPPDTKYAIKGSLQGWRDEVASKCLGNSRLTVGVSAAFAPPLLRYVGEAGGGIHFTGSSQTGKTTILVAAGSVWGGGGLNGFLDSWRTTANGLEGVAEAHCDALLCLDELGQVEARDAGEAAYMLANGSGKGRAHRDGSSRQSAQWRLLFLSSGELSLSDKMGEIGRRPKGGQEVRLIDLKAEPPDGYGAFETLHGAKNVGEFCSQIRSAASSNYGLPIRFFLDRLIYCFTKVSDELLNRIKTVIGAFLTACPANASGQVRSVCRRFALVGAAGEIATAFGLTGWPLESAVRSALICFYDWLIERGTPGDHDLETGIRQVIGFIEAHGASRFETAWEANAERVLNRAGFRKRDWIPIEDPVTRLKSSGPSEWQYMILPEAWRSEVCRGYDAKAIAAEMVRRKLLEPGTNGKAAKQMKVPGAGNTRLYVLTKSIVGGSG